MAYLQAFFVIVGAPRLTIVLLAAWSGVGMLLTGDWKKEPPSGTAPALGDMRDSARYHGLGPHTYRCTTPACRDLRAPARIPASNVIW